MDWPSGEDSAPQDQVESRFPAALLKSYVEHEFFADLVKSAVISSEMDMEHERDPLPGDAPYVDMKFAAAVLFFFVSGQEVDS